MKKLLAVLVWRVKFARYGRRRVEGGFWAAWLWSGECWENWWDERLGMNCPRESFREEMYTACLEGGA